MMTHQLERNVHRVGSFDLNEDRIDEPPELRVIHDTGHMTNGVVPGTGSYRPEDDEFYDRLSYWKNASLADVTFTNSVRHMSFSEDRKFIFISMGYRVSRKILYMK